MNIIIPMAGLGSRFSKSGFLLPKPMITVIDKPMYRYAVDCLPLHLASNLLFILRETQDSSAIENDIKKNYQAIKHYQIIKLPYETEGQAETILKCSDYIQKDKPTLIHNCDTYIQANFDWEDIGKREIDGAIVLFSSNEPRWSYAKLDQNQKYVTEFKEKIVISPHASTGTYYFKNTQAMLETIQSNIQHNIRQNNEFYLSTVYQCMIDKHEKIIPLWVKKMLCFGTPQDLVMSLNQIVLERQAFL